MNSRTEAAAIALASGYEGEAKYYIDDAKAALGSADAHDAAHGVHRVSLDALTKAIYEVDPLKFFGSNEPEPWEKLGPAWRALARSKAEAVLAAAVGGDGE